MNDFYKDLQYSIENRDDKKLNEFYKKAFPLAEKIEFCNDLETQKKGVDKIIYFKDGKTISIDEKKRRIDYGDILLELRSNKERKTPGWLYYSQCDYIVYAIIPSGTIYLLPVLLMQMAWKRNKEQWIAKYPRKYADNKFYTTENIAVPTKILLNAICEEMKRQIQ